MRKAIAIVMAATLFVTTTLPAYAAERSGGHRALPEHVQKALDHLHERIDAAKDLSPGDKARFHEVADQIETHQATVEGATERLLVLTGTSVTPERRAEIEAQVRQELAKIGDAHATLASMQRKIHAEIQASAALSAAAKAEVEAMVQKLEDGSLSLEDAIKALESKTALGGSNAGGYAGGFVLILVLFILLVIIGAGFGDG